MEMSIDRHFCRFHVLVTVNNVTVCIGRWLFYFISLRSRPTGGSCFNFLRISILLSVSQPYLLTATISGVCSAPTYAIHGPWNVTLHLCIIT
jgi:hypothetical protein